MPTLSQSLKPGDEELKGQAWGMDLLQEPWAGERGLSRQRKTRHLLAGCGASEKDALSGEANLERRPVW